MALIRMHGWPNISHEWAINDPIVDISYSGRRLLRSPLLLMCVSLVSVQQVGPDTTPFHFCVCLDRRGVTYVVN